MENTRPILYGVADYAEIRKANAWFIDRTAKIRDLEGTRYAVFLRPRRFGKSFLVSLLEYCNLIKVIKWRTIKKFFSRLCLPYQ